MTAKPKTCPVNSHTEWGLLEEVIIGNPAKAFANFWEPVDEMVFSNEELADIEKYVKLGQPYPPAIIDAACQAVERLKVLLQSEGVFVKQVKTADYSHSFSSPHWQVKSGFCSANPRDPFIIIGDQIIETPMSARSRYFEGNAYHDLFQEYADLGARWVSAPRPLLLDELYNKDYELEDSPTPYVLTNIEPVFDAADFVRCGRDIIGQLSNVTNQAGVDWLQTHLGSDYKIHLIKSLDPKPVHIDTTLMPLCPGKVLVNPVFTDISKLPDIFKSWQVLQTPKPVPYKVLPRMMSDWISMNTLMLDEKRIVVEERQTPLITALKGWGFDPIPCAFEDYYPFVGGFHCATLDIRRQGQLESYF